MVLWESLEGPLYDADVRTVRRPSGDDPILFCVCWVITLCTTILRQLFWVTFLNIFKTFNMFLAFCFYCYCKIHLMSWRVYSLWNPLIKSTSDILDFCKITIRLAFIFIIFYFKDILFFHLLKSNYYRRNFHKGGFLMGQYSLLGFSWERKFRGNFPGDIFQEEVLLNRRNHSTKVQIFQRS